MLNLATLLEESARTWPERPAVIQDDNPLSYRALNEMANRVANLLAARGVRPGERVALACRTGRSFRLSITAFSKAARWWCC